MRDYLGSGASAGIALQLTKNGSFRPDIGLYWSIQGGGLDFGFGKGTADLGVQAGGICEIAGKGVNISAQYGRLGGGINWDASKVDLGENTFSGVQMSYGPGYNIGASASVNYSWSIRDGFTSGETSK